jgi:regulator of protease activity HflC (stomatin/prohibitin superfamily)
MKAIKTVSLVIIVLIVGSWVTINVVTVYVPVGMAGVRTQEYGVFGKKGVVPADFGPGWHRDLGPIDSWVFFDSTVQTLEMTRDPERGSVKGRDDVQVQSADGYAVSVDVTVKYRIMAGNAHKVYQDTGSGVKYKTIVRNEAQRACIGLFGAMKTEGFYNPMERRKTAEAVKGLLEESLRDNFVEVIDVLIRNVQFDPEYENKIRRKKLADQEVELNKSMARAEEMRGKTQVIEAETQKLISIIQKEKDAQLVKMQAETDRQIAKIIAEYEKYATEKQADADLIAAQMQAEGALLVRRAEAEGERLRNLAMEGVGGSTIVALEAARNLQLNEVTLSTMNIDFLDIDGMATKLGVPESSGHGPSIPRAQATDESTGSRAAN